jgi:[acyl-carrier-protein] S-malonyltransferase
MQPVAEHLATALADLDWSVPAVPVVPGADGWPTTDPGRLAEGLRRQLTSPVLWADCCAALAAVGAAAVVEVGAAPVLGRLVRGNRPELAVHLAAGPGAPVPGVRPTAPTPEPALAAPGPPRGER